MPRGKSKASQDNLIPLNRLTKEERREMASKAGKASVEARRNKKSMREAMQTLMAMEAIPSQKATLKTIGYKDDEMTNINAFATKLYMMAMNGNLQAADMCMRLGVLSPEEERKEKESDARIQAMGKDGNNITIESGETSRVQIYLPEIESKEE